MNPQDNKDYQPSQKSKIEELKKALYSRTAPEVRNKRHVHFGRTEVGEVKEDWEHQPETEEEVILNNQYKYENHSMSFFTKLLIASAIFFIIAVGSGIFLVLKGENIISTNNIDIAVRGPVTIAGGDPVTFDIQVVNKNNVKLQTVDMVVEFPSGTVDADDTSKQLKQFQELMDDIAPGGVGQKTVRAVIYGEENSKKDIVISISYKVAGSNAVFRKQKTYQILVSSSPLSLAINSFKEVTSGQEFEIEVSLTSNSEEVISNLLLKASYPFGFTYISNDSRSAANISVWKIGDIPPNGKKTIKLKGKLEGQDDEVRIFNFTAGAQSTRDSEVIGTEYVAASQEISIRRPFITATISLNDDDSGEYIGAFNTPIKATVSWFNNLPTAIIDGEIYVKLSGNAFDKNSVSPGDGYYKSADNEIVWNKITTSSLGNIGPGESGSITFTLTPRDFSTPLKPVTNPNLYANVDVRGKRLSESNVPESISSSAKRLMKISSKLSLSSAIVRSQGQSSGTGPFLNTGPIPPRAEKQTTYTVVWTVNNTANTITGAEVRALLPAYVKWMGKTSPVGEDISYNSNTGEVVWRVGNVNTYTVNTSQSRQVAFQVAIEPSVAQIGQVPTIVQDTTLVGVDDYTGENLTSTASALSTRFTSDPAYKEGSDVVAP